MEIFGVGTAELVAIFIIMLIVAGPKRMIQWAYILGQYTSKLRKMWAETMTYVQKEFEAAGMDVELPKEIPTRGTLTREIAKLGEKAMAPVTAPVKETMTEVNNQFKQIKEQVKIPETNGAKSPSPVNPPPQPPGSDKPNFGTWSGGDSTDQPSP